MECGISNELFASHPRAYEMALSLGLGALTLRKCAEKADELFVYKPMASLKGIIMSWCHSCVFSILQPIPLPNAGNTACFFPFL